MTTHCTLNFADWLVEWLDKSLCSIASQLLISLMSPVHLLNSLPSQITSLLSFVDMQSSSKTFLVRCSYPKLVITGRSQVLTYIIWTFKPSFYLFKKPLPKIKIAKWQVTWGRLCILLSSCWLLFLCGIYNPFLWSICLRLSSSCAILYYSISIYTEKHAQYKLLHLNSMITWHMSIMKHFAAWMEAVWWYHQFTAKQIINSCCI